MTTPTALRRAIGGFVTGVAVITTELDGERHGMTANSLTSVSLDPPLVLVCLTRDARTLAALRGRGAFVINLLNERQLELAKRFALPGHDHFDGLPDAQSPMGLPTLPRGVGRLECELDRILDGGDHEIVIGRVVRCDAHEGTPLVFYRGRFHELHGEGHDAPWLW